MTLHDKQESILLQLELQSQLLEEILEVLKSFNEGTPKKEIELINFELPKEIIDKLKLNTEYEVRGYWDYDGNKWQWEIIEKKEIEK